MTETNIGSNERRGSEMPTERVLTPRLSLDTLDSLVRQQFPLHPGMTLRDWFAGQTLASLAEATPQMRAEFAYQTADAMLKIRESNATHERLAKGE